MDKYVPLKTNACTLFWVNYLLSGEMDESSKFCNSSIDPAIKPKKGGGQLFCQKGTWYFSFALTFQLKDFPFGDKATGAYLSFSGKRIGHIRRKFSRLRRILMKQKNLKALKRLENKEQRIASSITGIMSSPNKSFNLRKKKALPSSKSKT